FVYPDAEHYRVVNRQVARSQLGFVDHFDVDAHLPQSFGAVVAAAHHVTDHQAARDLHVEDLGLRRRLAVDQMRLDVRVPDQRITVRGFASVSPGYGPNIERSGRSGRRSDFECSRGLFILAREGERAVVGFDLPTLRRDEFDRAVCGATRVVRDLHGDFA